MTEASTPQDRRDILIARVVDGRASAEDWRELRALAADDQSVWSDIAEEQELTRELTDAVDRAGAAADRVDLPPLSESKASPAYRLRLVGVAGGWVAAAAIGVAWITGLQAGDPVVVGGGRHAGAEGPAVTAAGMPNPITTAADALKEYLKLGKQSGEVIGELPTSVVLDRTPNAEGGYDVVYLRQIVEKTTVDSIYETATGDAGQVFVVPKDEPEPPATAY